MKNKNPTWQDRIVTDLLILAGKPTIKGTRISVELIMELLDGGRSEADIIRRSSHITLKDIQACREYAACLWLLLAAVNIFTSYEDITAAQVPSPRYFFEIKDRCLIKHTSKKIVKSPVLPPPRKR